MSPPPGFPGKAFFDAVYEGRAPWDIGAPQPDLMALVAEFPPRGRLLDLGCGTGDLAIGLARAGHPVLGVDFAEAALAVARERLQELPPEQRSRVEFRYEDALRPSTFGGEFGSAIDSGFLHLFEAPTRRALIAELGATLPRGGRYYQLGFAISIPSPDAPRQVAADEMAALFTPEAGWAILASRPAVFKTVGFDDIPALAFCAERVR